MVMELIIEGANLRHNQASIAKVGIKIIQQKLMKMRGLDRLGQMELITIAEIQIVLNLESGAMLKTQQLSNSATLFLPIQFQDHL